MTTLYVANDIHVFGPHQLIDEHDTAIEHCQYLLGDIVDMANVKNDKVDQAKIYMERLIAMYHGGYIMGNHELYRRDYWQDIRTPDHIVIKQPKNPILLCHGHIPLWGKERSKKWMGKKAGAGFLKRTFSRLFNKWRDKFGGFKITDDDLLALAHYAIEKECKTIIIGHKHPLETMEFKKKGIRIVILKRGFNEIKI